MWVISLNLFLVLSLMRIRSSIRFPILQAFLLNLGCVFHYLNHAFIETPDIFWMFKDGLQNPSHFQNQKLDYVYCRDLNWFPPKNEPETFAILLETKKKQGTFEFLMLWF